MKTEDWVIRLMPKGTGFRSGIVEMYTDHPGLVVFRRRAADTRAAYINSNGVCLIADNIRLTDREILDIGFFLLTGKNQELIRDLKSGMQLSKAKRTADSFKRIRSGQVERHMRNKEWSRMAADAFRNGD